MCNIISVTKTSRLLLMLTGLLVVSACTQMPRHGNMLVFGTNTSVGLNVGKDASQTPAVQIGINRQEVALVPLSANTAVEEGGGNLIPCPASTVYLDNEKPQDIRIKNLEDCKFVATHDGKSRDSYSTLASFGAESSSGGDVKLAQYFATGIAAQRLVETGGANVVLAGSSADIEQAASAVQAAADARKAEAEARKAEAMAEYNAGRQVALVIMGNDPDAPVTDEMMGNLEKAIGSSSCTKGKFEIRQYPKNTVKAFLDALEDDNPACIIKLRPRN